MPMPSACRISEAAAICVATEMRCITNGMNLRVDHVALRLKLAVRQLACCRYTPLHIVVVVATLIDN